MPIALTQDTIVVASSDLLSCDLGGEAAILNPDRDAYYGLNDVGAVVWSMVAEPRRIEEIRDALVERFDVTPKRCEDDLIALLNALAANGLIEIRNEQSG